MLERVGLPISFVMLWSSAFVAAKSGVVYATPFAFLAVRFAIVAAIFMTISALICLWHKAQSAKLIQSIPITKDTLLKTVIVGILLHGCYLGCSFYAMANGLGAALIALIVSTQPLLTTALSIIVFDEKPTILQWVGITIGFIGVTVVLVPSLGTTAPPLSLISGFFALVAITCGTLMQKKIGSQISLLKSNLIQATAATVFFVILINTVEDPKIEWTLNFIYALVWQVLAVSTGAYLILMILIRRRSVAATTSLLFMVPPTTAIIANFWLNEPLTLTTLAGFCMASAGVYLASRYTTHPTA